MCLCTDAQFAGCTETPHAVDALLLNTISDTEYAQWTPIEKYFFKF